MRQLKTVTLGRNTFEYCRSVVLESRFELGVIRRLTATVVSDLRLVEFEWRSTRGAKDVSRETVHLPEHVCHAK